jgi:hypothetical protein
MVGVRRRGATLLSRGLEVQLRAEFGDARADSTEIGVNDEPV